MKTVWSNAIDHAAAAAAADDDDGDDCDDDDESGGRESSQLHTSIILARAYMQIVLQFFIRRMHRSVLHGPGSVREMGQIAAADGRCCCWW